MPRPIDRLADSRDRHSTAMIYSRCTTISYVLVLYSVLVSVSAVSYLHQPCIVEELMVYTILNLYLILFIFSISFVYESA